MTMVKVLASKKEMVITNLVNMLDHRNKSDIEISLNSSVVLVELIEIEKTFEIFFKNNAKLISRIIELAVDPSNSFNQKYLIHILLQICKQLKPQNNANNLFKDLEDENSEEPKKFDHESIQGKQML
jgi:hypothetical protein